MTAEDKARETARRICHELCLDKHDDEQDLYKYILPALRDTERRVWEEASKAAWEVKDRHAVVSGDVVDMVREIAAELRVRAEKP